MKCIKEKLDSIEERITRMEEHLNRMNNNDLCWIL
jgi:archaellum component FlaC